MAVSRVAACSWSLAPADPDALVRDLGTLGIGAVQLDLDRLCTGATLWFPVVDRLREAGIAIVSGMMRMKDEDYTSLESIMRTGGVRPDETWRANRTRAEMVASLAAEIGLTLVTFHAGFIPESRDDPERATLLGRVREIADVFAGAGVRVGLETGQETAETLLEALTDLDAIGAGGRRGAVGVNFDPANMILYGRGDPVAALDALAARVVQIHVKDALPAATPGTWGREVPVGAGAVDWPAFLARALAVDPPVDLVIEREAGADRLADLARARDLVAGHVHASGGA